MQEWRVMGAMRMGAQGYLTADSNPEELFKAIRIVFRGGTFLDQTVQSRVLALVGERMAGWQKTKFFILSSREQAVLNRLARGESNQQIADKLFVSKSTVKHYVSELLTKLDAVNRTEAVGIAINRGLIE